jgi:hypothetical protein
MTRKKPGRKFEEAVCAFAKTLDQSAEVLFDHKVPDRDTGALRQCDVWINAKFSGHWPLSILVSCKDHRRKLNSGDVGTFCDEKRSTSASTGVLYSRSGFTKPAVKKAQANGISCCRLYDNEPDDLPASVWIEQFLCKPVIQLESLTDLTGSGLRTWNDLFNVGDGENKKNVLDIIAETFSAGEARVLSEKNPSRRGVVSFPAPWTEELSLRLVSTYQNMILRVGGSWRKYRARSEATLLSGSYCVSDGSFRGTQVGPSIDTWGVHPGDAWEEIIDEDIRPPSNLCITILSGSDVRNVLREKIGPNPLSCAKK